MPALLPQNTVSQYWCCGSVFQACHPSILVILQLNEQGWMHHLARHSVACFLTR